jgi:hypothetical protein
MNPNAIREIAASFQKSRILLISIEPEISQEQNLKQD